MNRLTLTIATLVTLAISVLTFVVVGTKLPPDYFGSVPTLVGLSPFMVGLLSVLGAMVLFARHKYPELIVSPAMLAPKILEGMNQAVVILDADLKITYANSTAGQLFGAEITQLKTQSLKELFGEVEAKTIVAEALEPVKTGRVPLATRTANLAVNQRQVSMLVRRLDGTNPSHPSLMVVLTDLSKVTEIQQQNAALENTKKAMLNALEDAQALEQELRLEKMNVEQTVKKRTSELREEQTRLTASINSLTLGFIMTDDKLNIVSLNPTASKILDLAPGAKIADVAAKLSSNLDLTNYIQTSISTKQVKEIKDFQYGAKFLHFFLAPIIESNGQVIGSVILLEDISEEKATERSRDEFFSIASHELRTPLTSIRGNTGLIQEYYADQIKDPDMKEMINDIHESSIRLIEIVNDFLDTSRLEQGRMEFKDEPIDIVKLAGESLKELHSLAQEKGIYLKVEPVVGTPLAFADKDRVKQAIINLAGNALKFTDQGGITVNFAVEGQLVKVRVSDTGRGIPLESQHLLFRKFQQASNNILTRDTTRGTGLGLYITKLIIEGMGGTIGLEKSEANKGSVFTFALPIATAAQIAEASKQTKVAAPPPVEIPHG